MATEAKEFNDCRTCNNTGLVCGNCEQPEDECDCWEEDFDDQGDCPELVDCPDCGEW